VRSIHILAGALSLIVGFILAVRGILRPLVQLQTSRG